MFGHESMAIERCSDVQVKQDPAGSLQVDRQRREVLVGSA